MRTLHGVHTPMLSATSHVLMLYHTCATLAHVHTHAHDMHMHTHTHTHTLTYSEITWESEEEVLVAE